MWVARDKEGFLYLYEDIPLRDTLFEDWEPSYPEGCLRINPTLFPNLKWEDEPVEVELKLSINEINKRCY